LLTMNYQIIYSYEDERGEDVIEAMDLWKNQRGSSVHGAQNLPVERSTAMGSPPLGHRSRFGQ
jgi:hypothetical protein